MRPKLLTMALLSAAAVLPASAHAADDYCSRMFIYTVNQFCSWLPNGLSQCQPIALAGPGPNCKTDGAPALVQVPLGPPAIQMPSFAAGNSPYPANPYLPFAASANPNAPGYSPAAAYVPPPMQPFTLPTFGATATPPSTTAATAQMTPPTAQPLEKLMPDTAPADPSSKVASVGTVLPAATMSNATTTSTAAAPATTNVDSAGDAAGLPPPVSAISGIAMPPVTVTTLVPAPVAANQAAPVSTAQSSPVPSTASTTAAAPIPISAHREQAANSQATQAQAETVQQNLPTHFEFDSAKLTANGQAMLDAWLAQDPCDKPVLVTGHADRLGPDPYNKKLSIQRAEAVKKYLVEKGKTASNIQIVAQGESVPIISCPGDASPETIACLAPNRRAEIIDRPIVKPVAKHAQKKTHKSIVHQKPKTIHR